jgi:hypothetical protein
MNERCTSGRSIAAIGQHSNNPCGRELVVIAKTNRGNPVTVCPHCDIRARRILHRLEHAREDPGHAPGRAHRWRLGLRRRRRRAAVLIVNQSTLVTDEQIQDALPAFQQAVTNDFAPVWGTDATLTTDPATEDAWTVTITDEPDVLFAAGYHYLDHGRPAAKVFADAMPWQLVLTHELFEMLVDPWLNRSVRAHGKWWLVEVGDPVETRSYQLPSASRVAGEHQRFRDACVVPPWFARPVRPQPACEASAAATSRWVCGVLERGGNALDGSVRRPRSAVDSRRKADKPR